METEKHFQIIDNHVVYDFEKTMSYLNRYGKSKFGDKFQLLRTDSEILFKLMCYAIRDEAKCKKYNIDLNKGILLIGKIGCGKTSLMDIFRILYYRDYHYQLHSVREIAKEFVLDGFPVLNKYGKRNKIICFDDLGVETSIKHFGNECNVMGEILLSRYDLLHYHGIVTHATTNLNANDLEKLYGNRVRSRLREMFNVISFPSDVLDKRK